MTKKLITTLEKEHGIMLIGSIDVKRKYSDDEFTVLLADSKTEYVGVNHEDRVEFLKNNGYEVTRENMTNPELSVRQEDEE